MKHLAFTIININYLAQAQVLYKSVQKYLPNTDFFIYILDCEQKELDRIKEFSRLQSTPPEDPFWTKLRFRDKIKRIDVGDYAERYNVTEFCTSVKPSIFLELIAEFGGDFFYSYFDPDMEFFSDCQEFFNEAEKHSFWLTPHFFEPPEDNYQPSAIDILAAGNYNFGYLGVNPAYFETLQGLHWWERRLERDSRIDHPNQIFVDQKWGSLFVNHSHSGICYGPEYNVSYWNLHERYLTQKDSTFIIANKKLGFFHFSGFIPLAPVPIFKHQNRFKIEALPIAYQNLFQSYAKKLIDCGYQIWPTFKTLGNLSVAKKISSPNNIIWPHLYKSPDKIKELSLIKALFWLGLIGLRKNCQIIIAIGRDKKNPNFWKTITKRYISYLIRAQKLIKSLIIRKKELPYRQSKFGVIGFLGGGFGTGESGRNIANLVLSISQNCLLYDISDKFSSSSKNDSGHTKYLNDLRKGDQVECLIMAANADRVSQIMELGFYKLFAQAKKRIGYWWWETENFPHNWIYQSFYFDEIWVGTDFVKKSLEKTLPIPVRVVPLPISDNPRSPKKKPPLQLDDKAKYLLTIFDGNSFLERKNPWGTIRAFKTAFDKLGKKSRLHLIIKTMNVKRDDQDLIEKELEGYPFTFINEPYSEEEGNYLLDLATAFISLHRSEGLGLNIISAMLFEKPVIVTNYSGNLDFTTPQNSYLIDGPQVEATMEAGVYQGSFWCEPDNKQAAQAIINILSRPGEAEIKGKRARHDILQKYSTQKIKSLLIKNLT
jgi:glycosyltransferase involved in cell wall biosynthesis